jgi:hypothetical protein
MNGRFYQRYQRIQQSKTPAELPTLAGNPIFEEFLENDPDFLGLDPLPIQGEPGPAAATVVLRRWFDRLQTILIETFSHADENNKHGRFLRGLVVNSDDRQYINLHLDDSKNLAYAILAIKCYDFENSQRSSKRLNDDTPTVCQLLDYLVIKKELTEQSIVVTTLDLKEKESEKIESKIDQLCDQFTATIKTLQANLNQELMAISEQRLYVKYQLG